MIKSDKGSCGFLGKNRGTTLIEAMLAAVFIAAVAILVSRMLFNTVQAGIQTRNTRKATSLAQMVLDRYAYKCMQSIYSAQQLDSVRKTAGLFFAKPTHLGYDNFLITSQTTYSSSVSTCTVKVTIEWPSGGGYMQSVFTKTVGQTSASPTTNIVNVYVKVPCGIGLTDAEIIANCNTGLVGMQVAVRTPQGNVGTTFTDSTGWAVMTGVPSGPSVNLELSSVNFSSFTIPLGAPGYIPAYYRPDPLMGGYTSTELTSVAIASSGVTTLLIKDFLPAGTIVGRIINDAGGSASTMTVSMDGGMVVAHAGIFKRCGIDITPCSTSSDASGNFQYANVIPSAGNISVSGFRGSDMSIPRGNINYVQGYSGAGTAGRAIISYPGSWNLAVTPPFLGGTQLDLHVTEYGELDIFTEDALSPGTPVTNARVNVGLPRVSISSFTSNSNGHLKLYNVFPYNNWGGQFTANKGSNNYGQLNWGCGGTCMNNQLNSVTIPMMGGLNYVGVLQDLNVLGPPLSAFIVSVTTKWIGSSVAAGSGHFNAVASVFPASLGITNPTPPFQVAVPTQVSADASYSIPVVLSVQINDMFDNTTNSVNGLKLSYPVNGNPWTYPTVTVYGGSANNITFMAPYFNTNGNGTIAGNYGIVSDCSVAQCTPVGGGPVPYGTLVINSSLGSISINDAGPAGVTGYHTVGPKYIGISTLSPTITTTINATLNEYPVTGVVVNASDGSPVGGVAVVDQARPSNFVTSHATNGTFTIWCTVVGRSQNGTGNIAGVGKLKLMIADMPSYYGTNVVLDVPAPVPSNLAPLIQNLSVTPVGGSHP